jgi:hypothetical protein
MDKYSVLAAIAPIAAPAAPATMLVNILYAELAAEQVNASFALGAAVLSGIGAEASGMIAAYVGIQAYRKQKYGLMGIAIIAFLAYAAFMAIGISQARNPLAMVSTIIISIIAYLAVAILTDLRAILSDKAAETDLQVRLMDAERKLTNAQVRKGKAVHVAVNVDSKPGQYPKTSAETIAAIRQYWQAHPDATLREVGAACGVSPMTAGKYKESDK